MKKAIKTIFTHSTNVGFFLVAIIILSVFSFQYPLTSKLPLGNDAPTHIQNARYPISAPPFSTVADRFAPFKTTYRLSSSLFALARFLPFSWPQRFMIWMALGHLLTGLLLGYLLRKFAGLIPAFIGMVFWSISVVGVLSFVQIGFMPQLWSMIFLLLFFEKLHAKSKIGVGLSLIAMWFAHPGTFIVCALALVITLPQYIFSKLDRVNETACTWKRVTVSVASALLLILLFIAFKRWPSYIALETEFNVFRTISEILKSQIGIIVPFTPIGLIIFSRLNSISKFFRLYLVTFGALSIVLGFNSLLGIGILESRFFPFAIISIIIFGSIGIWKVLQTAFAFGPLRYLVLTVILAVAIFQGWHTAGAYFANPGIDKTYQQLQPNQVEVFGWIKQNLPSNAVIAQNDSLGDGVIRWLPVLTDRGTTNGGYLNKNSCADVMNLLTQSSATYMLYFKKFETMSTAYETNPLLFKKVYDTEEAVIYELPVKQAQNAEQIKIKPATLCAN
ncbi:MAG: hypothetical protein Q7S57_02485 [bacterium]|nr:hypothetical protein [bacterium]